MPRYFIEVAYLGTAYGGFQIQQNADTVQGQIEKAFHTFFRDKVELTGSSRTDAGVHAKQNFFHTDTALFDAMPLQKLRYHVNAILPPDIVIKNIFSVAPDAHSRFDAKSRYYVYTIVTEKNPFLQQTAYFFPYKVNKQLLHDCAELLLKYTNYECYSKKHTQVKTFECKIISAKWIEHEGRLEFHVEGSRFLRGMVKGLVGTMLKVALGKLPLLDFEETLQGKLPEKVDFSVPSEGLCLVEVKY